MIYELRTYDIKPRTVDQFGENTKLKLEGRLKFSDLGGFWYTEIGPLNQVVHIWPYDDANHRAETRYKAVSEGDWPPDNDEIVLNMNSEIMLPAPFMRPLEPQNIGPVYEMRVYTYKPGEIPKVLDAWGGAIEKREEYSPLVGCWYSDVGDLNKFIHMWAYDSLESRTNIRAATIKQGIWPPKGGIAPLKQENKILLPFDFSPLQ